ncbi:hypothetical protein J7K74_03500 [Candidatus Woesearchaeota archaeon]|nr:hypothetical protein [Candidatus Woesearchaeota archaeon]
MNKNRIENILRALKYIEQTTGTPDYKILARNVFRKINIAGGSVRVETIEKGSPKESYLYRGGEEIYNKAMQLKRDLDSIVIESYINGEYSYETLYNIALRSYDVQEKKIKPRLSKKDNTPIRRLYPLFNSIPNKAFSANYKDLLKMFNDYADQLVAQEKVRINYSSFSLSMYSPSSMEKRKERIERIKEITRYLLDLQPEEDLLRFSIYRLKEDGSRHSLEPFNKSQPEQLKLFD